MRISQFLKIDEHFYPFQHYLVFSREYFFVQNNVFKPWGGGGWGRGVSAQREFKMAMKQPTLASGDQDGLSPPSTSRENTHTCSFLSRGG